MNPLKVLTRQDILPLERGARIEVAAEAIVTDSAREEAAERGVTIVLLPKDAIGSPASADRSIALGADHGGFAMKEQLKKFLLDELHFTVKDYGTYDSEPVDYPDYAYLVAQAVAKGECRQGIMIDGAGIGSAMAANKVPGIRAALCYDKATARNSREHNNANVLSLGGKLHSLDQLKDIVTTWLTTKFAGGRHQKRVDKIMEIEKRFLRKE
ncbi:MAG: ribose 5-phosphate isomerase B [Acidobacteriia bacterium]|nr:ribose 5-phosphate isomerase B [Terriglobia bacterium]